MTTLASPSRRPCIYIPCKSQSYLRLLQLTDSRTKKNYLLEKELHRFIVGKEYVNKD